MKYLSVKEIAEKWGVSQRRIHQYCKDERIEGAERIGNAWAIPANAKKPEDPRRKRKQMNNKNLKIGAVIAAAGITDNEGQVSPFMIGDCETEMKFCF